MTGLWSAYSLKSIWARRVTMGLMVLGMGLVAFVLTAVLMLAHGLERVMGNTGDPENVLILRKGALSEIDSTITREHADSLGLQPGIRTAADGRQMVVKELNLQLTLRKKAEGTRASVSLRGTAPEAFLVRPQVRIVQGRAWAPGTTEVVVGAQVARQFTDARLQQVLRFGNRDWTVVGVFEARGSGFDSEVWGDAEQFMATFQRTAYSMVTARVTGPDAYAGIKARVERDPRFSLTVKREPEYYEGKAGSLARIIRVTGLFLTVVFGIGAVLGATMTMSTSVAQRTTEIATLRTLGFTRVAIVRVFLLEAVGLGLLAGLVGVGSAMLLQSVTISTMNQDTATEIVFGFQASPEIALLGLAFALAMSLVGGLVPAIRAARLVIVQALGERTT